MTKKQITKTEQMRALLLKFKKDYEKIKYKTVEEYLKILGENDDKNEKLYSDKFINEINSLDDIAFFRAWLEDRMDGNSGAVSGPGYTRSRTKKIRKALGYSC